MIAHLYPEYPKARLDERAEDIAQARVAAGANYPSDVAAGLKLGRAVAERYIAQAKRDGYTRKWDGRRPRGPEHWEPPPGSTGQPIQPLAGHVEDVAAATPSTASSRPRRRSTGRRRSSPTRATSCASRRR